MTKSSEYSPARTLAWVVVALLVAVSAYLYNLGGVSFWEDESWLVIAIGDSPLDVWTFATEKGVHPPLYFYLAYLVQFAFGTGEFALRWFGGLIALIGLAFTYRLTADQAGRRAGVFAIFLAAGSLFLIYYARLARQYTLFFTLSAMLMWAYGRWQQHKTQSGGRWWWVIMLVQAAALYTHYFSIFLAFTVGLHALLTQPFKRTLWLAGAIGISGLLFLPWVPSILTQLGGEHGSGLSYGGYTLAAVLENFAGRMSNANLWLGGILGTAGLLALVRQRRWRLLLWLIIWIAITLAIIVFVNQYIFRWYIGRNMLYILPGMALLFGIGLSGLSRSRIGHAAAWAAVVAWVAWGAFIFTAYWPGTPGWRGIMQLVARDARPGDTFVIDGEPYSADYYLRQYLQARVTLYDMDSWQWEPLTAYDDDRIWLIDSDQAVNFEAIAALPPNMKQTRRLVRLPVVAEFYQTLPDTPEVTYGEQLALGIAEDTLPDAARAGETLWLDLWWRAERQPDFNYSAGVFLLDDAGRVIAQQDGNFDSGRMDAGVLPVGEWVADARSLVLPADMPPGEYRLAVTVYDWRDGTRLPTDKTSDDGLYTIGSVRVTNTGTGHGMNSAG